MIYPLGFLRSLGSENAAPLPRVSSPRLLTPCPTPMLYHENRPMGHLQSVLALCLMDNPPLESPIGHGYDTRSLRHIDGSLGWDADFAAMRRVHAHCIRVVLRCRLQPRRPRFWAFRDVQGASGTRPKDWFHISFDGDSCYGDGFWYEGWEGHFELVKLNLQNPAVVDYLLESVRRWARRLWRRRSAPERPPICSTATSCTPPTLLYP